MSAGFEGRLDSLYNAVNNIKSDLKSSKTKDVNHFNHLNERLAEAKKAISIVENTPAAHVPEISNKINKLSTQIRKLENKIHNLSTPLLLSTKAKERVADTLEMHRKSELMRRLKPDEFAKIVANVEKLPKLTEDVIQGLSKGQWDDPIFHEPNWVAYAFKAFFEGAIDQNRLVTLNLYDTALSESSGNVSTYKLKNSDGTLNEEAFKVLVSGSSFFMNDEEKNALKVRIMELKPEDTSIFTVPLPNFDQGKELISYAYHHLKFTFAVTETTPRHQIIIPPNLMQTMLNSRYGENGVVPNPVFGFSSPEDFKKTDRRDIWIPSRYEDVDPNMHLHYHPCSRLAAYMHDTYYHCLVESADPHRQLWREIAGHFEKYGMTATWDYMLDRNFPAYLFNRNYQHDINFLLSLIQAVEECNRANGENPPNMSKEEGQKAGKMIKEYLMTHANAIAINHPINMQFIFQMVSLGDDNIIYLYKILNYFKDEPNLAETGGMSLVNELIDYSQSKEKFLAFNKIIQAAYNDDLHFSINEVKELAAMLKGYDEIDLFGHIHTLLGSKSNPQLLRAFIDSAILFSSLGGTHSMTLFIISLILGPAFRNNKITLNDLKEIAMKSEELGIHPSRLKILSENTLQELPHLVESFKEQYSVKFPLLRRAIADFSVPFHGDFLKLIILTKGKVYLPIDDLWEFTNKIKGNSNHFKDIYEAFGSNPQLLRELADTVDYFNALGEPHVELFSVFSKKASQSLVTGKLTLQDVKDIAEYSGKLGIHPALFYHLSEKAAWELPRVVKGVEAFKSNWDYHYTIDFVISDHLSKCGPNNEQHFLPIILAMTDGNDYSTDEFVALGEEIANALHDANGVETVSIRGREFSIR